LTGSGNLVTIRTVRFYTKPGCHLCEQAEELLEALMAECPLDLEMIDITTDVDIFDRYRYEIPVIAVEGGGTASGRITEADLRRVLHLGLPRHGGLPGISSAPPDAGKVPERRPK
jgi:glutaredoxin